MCKFQCRWPLCVALLQAGDLSKVHPCHRPKAAGFLVRTPLHSCTHTVQLPVFSEMHRLLPMSSSLSLSTHNYNAYTNTPARMALLTPEISEPWEVPDGGCRLGACSPTVLVHPGRWKKRQDRVAYWILVWTLQIHSTVDSRHLRFAAEM